MNELSGLKSCVGVLGEGGDMSHSGWEVCLCGWFCFPFHGADEWSPVCVKEGVYVLGCSNISPPSLPP